MSIRYYELFGLPGAGKSTITSPVIQYFKSRGYKVGGYRDVNGKGEGNPIEWLKLFCHFSEYRLFFYYWQLYRSCNQRNYKYLKKLIYNSHQLIQAVRGKKYDILFLEEGLIQALSSLFYLEDIPDNHLIEKIRKLVSKEIHIMPIFCSVDINVSMDRIRDRPTQQKARYSHSVGSSVLEDALIHRKHNLEVISSAFQSNMKIDMNASVDTNVSLIISLIEKNMKN